MRFNASLYGPFDIKPRAIKTIDFVYSYLLHILALDTMTFYLNRRARKYCTHNQGKVLWSAITDRYCAESHLIGLEIVYVFMFGRCKL